MVVGSPAEVMTALSKSGIRTTGLKLFRLSGTQIRPARSIQLHFHRTQLASSAIREYTIKLWDTNTWTEVTNVQESSDWIRSVAFSPDGRLLARGGDDRLVRLWDTANWTEVATLTGHANWVRSVTFSPDGHWLASAGDDGIVNLWNTDNLQEIVSFDHADRGYSVAFSPDGRLLASSGSEGVIKIWDVIGKRHIITLAGSSFSDRLGTFSPDGQLLASSGGYSGITLWDTNNWQVVARLLEHTDLLVWSTVFSPDGQLFVSSG
jgi:WD40 repeat protein